MTELSSHHLPKAEPSTSKTWKGKNWQLFWSRDSKITIDSRHTSKFQFLRGLEWKTLHISVTAKTVIHYTKPSMCILVTACVTETYSLLMWSGFVRKGKIIC